MLEHFTVVFVGNNSLNFEIIVFVYLLRTILVFCQHFYEIGQMSYFM